MTIKSAAKSKKRIKSLIPPDLISNHCFKEIAALLQQKSELSNQDRYFYGYSLTRLQQPLDALITWWPLATKGHAELQQDCASLLTSLFKNENFFNSSQIAEDALRILFFAIRTLAPNSQAAYQVRQAYFEFLWAKKDLDSLENILKSPKETFSEAHIENLGKISLLNAKNKFDTIPRLVGNVLTGGAALIKRDPTYHHDIAESMSWLAQEIKYALQAQFQHKNLQHTSINDFINFEAGILTQVLQLAIHVPHLKIIPSPAYVLTYERNQEICSSFLSWLASVNKSFSDLYESKLKLPAMQLPDTHSLITTPLESQATHYQGSLLSQKDPFQIIGADLKDTKKMIIDKVMVFIQRTPSEMAMVRQAQNELFIPSRRFIHQYFRYLATPNEVIATNSSLSEQDQSEKIPFRAELFYGR